MDYIKLALAIGYIIGLVVVGILLALHIHNEHPEL